MGTFLTHKLGSHYLRAIPCTENISFKMPNSRTTMGFLMGKQDPRKKRMRCAASKRQAQPAWCLQLRSTGQPPSVRPLRIHWAEKGHTREVNITVARTGFECGLGSWGYSPATGVWKRSHLHKIRRRKCI